MSDVRTPTTPAGDNTSPATTQDRSHLRRVTAAAAGRRPDTPERGLRAPETR